MLLKKLLKDKCYLKKEKLVKNIRRTVRKYIPEVETSYKFGTKIIGGY